METIKRRKRKMKTWAEITESKVLFASMTHVTKLPGAKNKTETAKNLEKLFWKSKTRRIMENQHHYIQIHKTDSTIEKPQAIYTLRCWYNEGSDLQWGRDNELRWRIGGKRTGI